MSELTLERYGQALVDETERFAETALRAAGDTPVPTCPEWTLSRLVEHVGRTQRWVASIVEDRLSEVAQFPDGSDPLPAERGTWQSWLTAGASRLAAACAEAGVDAAVWNPADDGRSGTRFWLRRVVAETVIHRADAAATAEVAYQLDAELAADAITDHLAMVSSPGWAAHAPDSARALRGSGQTLHWHTTDEPSLGEAGEWFVERGPEGVTWQHRHGKADVALRGPAISLLLVLTRRRPISDGIDEDLAAFGDLDLLRHWVEHSAY